MSKQTSRTIAAQICYAVIYKKTHLTEAFSTRLTSKNVKEMVPFIKSLCFETIRNYLKLEDIWLQCLEKQPKDKLIRVIMTQALTEFKKLNKEPHVVVNEAVNTAKKLNKKWATGLINSTLRKAIELVRTESAPYTSEAAMYAHPQWWISQLKSDWPQNWQKILLANNQKPPLWIRAVRNHKITETHHRHSYLTSAFILNPQDITINSDFKKGLISVQDASAQMAAHIMQPKNGEKILDACAAPGGKTCHLLEFNPHITLDALEKYPNRAKKIHDNLQRTGLKASVIVADTNNHHQWFKGTKYQQILLDAPCSASGIIRRQPDIKYLRQRENLTSITEDQQKLLASTAKLLAVGGKLLYATCSVFKQENSDQIKLFLKTHPEFREIKLEYSFAEACEYGIQILPGTENMDGFYYCYLQKNDV